MTKRRIATSLLITALLVTMTPFCAFGASYTQATYNKAVQNAANANAAYNNAAASLNNAQNSLNSARQVERDKNNAYTRAANAKSSMENELNTNDELKAAKNNVTEKQTAADAAQNNADTANDYPAKYSAGALSEAQVNAETAAAGLATALTLKTNAQEALAEKQEDFNEKKSAYEEALANHADELENDPTYKAAKKRVSDAEDSVDSATALVAEKQAALDTLGKDFLESKAQIYTFASLREECLSAASLADYVDTEEFNTYVNYCLEPENIQKSIDFMKECNVIRASQEPSVGVLPVSYDYMIASIFGNAFAGYGMSQGNGHIFVTDCPSINLGENIAFGYKNSDPFNGLYYREKVIFLARQQGATDVESILPIFNEVEAESIANGHTFHTIYTDKNAFIEENIVGPANDTNHNSIGHYENIIDTDYKAMGFAYAGEIGRAEQTFGSDYKYIKVEPYYDENGIRQTRKRVNLETVTVDVFEQQFSEFKNAREAALADAKITLKSAQSELTSAKAALKEAEDNFQSTGSQELAAAKAAYENAETALTSAQLDLDAANTAYDAAVSEKNTADAELKDQSDNAHYWQEAEAANSALDKANNELTAAINERNDIERRIRAKYPEATNFDSSKAAYNAAVTARITAENRYKAAEAEYNRSYTAKASADAEAADQERNAYMWRNQPLTIKITANTLGAAKGSLTAKWKKLSSANQKKISGIQIQVSTKKNFKDAKTYTSGKATVQKKITKLKKKTSYYVRIRVYKGKNYGPWSAVKKIKTK